MTTSNQPLVRSSAMLFGALIALSAGQSHAQDALGNGQALDANPGQYGPGNYQRPSLVDELRFRNAIATGNAPGGLSFRGDLGYRAAGEFSGELGSDSLFAFRRDSLYSGLAGMGIRGTDAIQYQFALTTGSAPPRNLVGSLSYTRDNQYSTGAGFSTQDRSVQSGVIGIDQEQSAADPNGQSLSMRSNTITGFDGGSMLGTLRSSSTYNTTATLQPALLSVYEQGIDKSPVGLVASPLLGITPTPLVDERKPNPLVQRPGNADTDPTTPGGIPSARITTSYDELVEQMRQRVEQMREQSQTDGSSSMKPGETNDAWLVRQMEDLRAKLYGQQNPGDQPGDSSTDPSTDSQDPGANSTSNPADPGSDPSNSKDPSSTELPPIVSIPGDPESPLQQAIDEARGNMPALGDGVELYDPTQIAIDPETLEVLRGSAAMEVDQLLDPGAASRDIYSEHIVAGQRLMSQGRFFDAEERFTHALSIKPADVIAQLGRLHAQIGAGMLLSASVNLQTLFSAHPELISSRYNEPVIPSAKRIEELKQRLGERAGIIEPEIRTRALEGERVRVSAGMLLAYLGYQSSDDEAIEQGLGVVRELGSDSDRRFASLLGQLWEPSAP